MNRPINFDSLSNISKNSNFDYFSKGEKTKNKFSNTLQDYFTSIETKGKSFKKSYDITKKKEKSLVNKSSTQSLSKRGISYHQAHNKSLFKNYEAEYSFENKIIEDIQKRKINNEDYLKQQTSLMFNTIKSGVTNPFKPKTEFREINNVFISQINSIIYSKENSRKFNDYRVVKLFDEKIKAQNNKVETDENEFFSNREDFGEKEINEIDNEF